MTRAEVEEQLPLSELLEDSLFAKWMAMTPQVTWVTYSGRPWRVWVQRERGGTWARRDFKKYQKALKFLFNHLSEWHDAALCSKVGAFQPPVVRDKATKRKHHHIPARVGQSDKHTWCPHCRRPTIFTTFSQHHNFPKSLKPAPGERRCCICGIRLTSIQIYR